MQKPIASGPCFVPLIGVRWSCSLASKFFTREMECQRSASPYLCPYKRKYVECEQNTGVRTQLSTKLVLHRRVNRISNVTLYTYRRLNFCKLPYILPAISQTSRRRVPRVRIPEINTGERSFVYFTVTICSTYKFTLYYMCIIYTKLYMTLSLCRVNGNSLTISDTRQSITVRP